MTPARQVKVSPTRTSYSAQQGRNAQKSKRVMATRQWTTHEGGRELHTKLRVGTGSMGIGFTAEDDAAHLPSSKNMVVPEYGLSVQQMHVLGLTGEKMTKVPEIEAVRGFEVGLLVTFPCSFGRRRSCLLTLRY